jgi:transcriptional regulator with XRE-family HTH domain
MKPEVARRRIEAFERRFEKTHLIFACHAAFPLALTPDLLYKLWANFQRDIHGFVLGIPWVAVADLLLSSLCDEVGRELYEMDTAVRNSLLNRLKDDKKFGQQRINELSDFLLVYVRQQLQSNDQEVRDFAQAQRWTALAYVRPSEAARELRLALEQVYQQDRSEQLRLASLIETFAEPLAEFKPLLVYARETKNLAYAKVEDAVGQFPKVAREERQVEVGEKKLPLPDLFEDFTFQDHVEDSLEKKFAEAANHWNLTNLYADLASAKKIFAPHKNSGLTWAEKLHLGGLLCGYSPREIAERLHKSVRSVETDLSRNLYRYAEVLTGNTFTNWRNIVEWLEPKYKIQPKYTSSQITEDANYSNRYRGTLVASKSGINQVKYALNKRKITLLELARLCHTSESTIKRFLRRVSINKETFIGICNYIGLNWEEIITASQDAVNEEEEIKLKSVKYMLKLGATVEQIAQVLNLNVDQVIQATLDSS